jgi:menaquinone-9 beta-reductase
VTPEPAAFDVIVVGARCAGAATAMLLARAGRTVLLVDRGDYGADILSTHALMRGGVLQLARWNLLDRIVEAGTPPVRTTTFHLGDDTRAVPIKPKFGIDALYAPRRTLLDRVLVDGAREAGATVRHNVRVTALTRALDGSVDGVVLQDRSGSPFHVAAGWVVGADGMRSSVGDLAGAAVYRTGTHATGALYGYWPNLRVDGYHWYYGEGSAAGAIPTNDDQTLVFASVPSSRWSGMTSTNRFGGFLGVLREAAPDLADAVIKEGERPLTGFGGRQGYFRQSWGPGWALVGDAGYFKDPLTAHGITDALRDADLLANALLDGSPVALEEYQHLRDKWSRELFDVTDRIAAFTWTLSTVGDLLDTLAAAMAEEVRQLVEHTARRSAAISATL